MDNHCYPDSSRICKGNDMIAASKSALKTVFGYNYFRGSQEVANLMQT